MKIAVPRSLLGQFIALHVATALIAAIALTLGASALLHGTADHYQHNLLLQQAQRIARSLDTGNMGDRRIQADEDMLASGIAVAVIDRRRMARVVRGPSRPAMIAAAPMDQVARAFRRGVVVGVSFPTANGWVVVSQDNTAPDAVTDDIVTAFLKRFALISLPIAALVPLIGVLLMRRLTRRMTTVSGIAEGIGPRTIDVRIPTGLLPSEVEPLAMATNRALNRLAEGFRIQAAFAADVAHELRTPLAVIRLRADAVRDAEARSALLEAIDRAARVVAQLLALADLEQRIEDVGSTIDLRLLAESVVSNRAPTIIAGGRSIALEAPDAGTMVYGYAAQIVLALENLIDNATHHTPQGTEIVVQVRPGALLSVSDNGDRIAANQMARLKDRFWRADNTRSEGSGIGLSIVDRIARAHGGFLSIAPGPGGHGLQVTLVLTAGTDPPETAARV
ncbi:sensor histidine kinase [Sphingomonas sp. ERG5]|uniref:sensor histidine kinase n=1 Tax=Sphingomonas sp. ERG5 TaxID=1381597 RepID=UPI00054B324A|nr:ATP-binding protein [Sphingomonas sp. ERG5]